MSEKRLHASTTFLVRVAREVFQRPVRLRHAYTISNSRKSIPDGKRFARYFPLGAHDQGHIPLLRVSQS